jgi:hypothetical protein
MATWFHFPKNIPVDGSTVWIRVTYYYSDPFKAVWNNSTKLFTSVENSIEYPAYVVARWQY